VKIIFALLLFTVTVQAQRTLYACMSQTKDYVVGATLKPSGLFRLSPGGGWELLGKANPAVIALTESNQSSQIYLAAGNGLLEIPKQRGVQRILTGQDVTELRDVSLDPAGGIYFSYVGGVRLSKDGGRTWQEISGSLRRHYCDAVRADRTHPGVVIIGNEEGVFRSDDSGKSWRLAGASGFQVMRLEQSPHDDCFWLAGTQAGGLFSSTDCGHTFENVGAIGVGHNIFDIAFDPTNQNRVALAGWGLGVVVSSDLGKTWRNWDRALPNSNIWSVTFDPDHSGRIYAGVHEEGVYFSEDAGKTWVLSGLKGAIVYRMLFSSVTR